MARSKKARGTDWCNSCNVMNDALIVPVHKMKEKDFEKLGIDYWSSDFGDLFSNGT